MKEFQLGICSPDTSTYTKVTWQIKIHNACNLLHYEGGSQAHFGKDPMWLRLSSEALKWFEGKIWSEFSIFTNVHDYFLLGCIILLCVCVSKWVWKHMYLCLCMPPSARGWSVPWAVVSSRLSDYACLLQRQINPVNKSNPWPMAIAPSLSLCLCHLFTPTGSFILSHSLVYNRSTEGIWNIDQVRAIFIPIWYTTKTTSIFGNISHDWIM